MLDVGDSAPAFTLPDQAGRMVSLEDFRGRPLVLYFYPKDDTPGCTQEACSFRDRRAKLAEAGIAVVGVSPDACESHAKFAQKHGLPFPLLADADHQVAEAYGVWGEKILYGKKFVGLLRTTFLLDAEGRVIHRWRKPKTASHADEVLAVLAARA